jgi:lipopolysaccharide export system permease protein
VPTIDLMLDPTPRHQGELAWRIGLLLGAANLLLLGIGLAATNPRRASNWNLLFALLAFAVYYNLINLAQAWVAGGRLSMASALFGVHGAALALALLLIWWRDHATVAPPWRRQRADGLTAGAAP